MILILCLSILDKIAFDQLGISPAVFGIDLEAVIAETDRKRHIIQFATTLLKQIQTVTQPNLYFRIRQDIGKCVHRLLFERLKRVQGKSSGGSDQCSFQIIRQFKFDLFAAHALSQSGFKRSLLGTLSLNTHDVLADFDRSDDITG